MDLLTIREIIARTGLSERTFYRLRKRGEFPEPVRVSSNRRLVLFRSDQVDAWCRDQFLNH
jgi:excisionase family DNA binding protein